MGTMTRSVPPLSPLPRQSPVLQRAPLRQRSTHLAAFSGRRAPRTRIRFFGFLLLGIALSASAIVAQVPSELELMDLSDAEVYAADASGNALRRIIAIRANDLPYVLVVDRRPGEAGETEERRLLFHEGLLDRARVLTIRGNNVLSEREYEGIDPVVERRYDGARRVVEVVEFADNRRVSETRITPGAYGPTEAVTRAPDGELLSNQGFRYDRTGLLVAMDRRSATGSVTSSEYGYADRALRFERHTTGGYETTTAYDQLGRAIQVRESLAGETIVDATIAYTEDGGSLRSILDAAGEVVWVERYDEDGRLLERTSPDEADGGTAAPRTTYTYSEDGPTEVRTTDGEREDLRQIAYDAGRRTSEEVRRDGALVRRSVFAPDGWSRVDHYRNGQVILRTYYQGETRVREEDIRNGDTANPIRVRVLDSEAEATRPTFDEGAAIGTSEAAEGEPPSTIDGTGDEVPATAGGGDR